MKPDLPSRVIAVRIGKTADRRRRGKGRYIILLSVTSQYRETAISPYIDSIFYVNSFDGLHNATYKTGDLRTPKPISGYDPTTH